MSSLQKLVSDISFVDTLGHLLRRLKNGDLTTSYFKYLFGDELKLCIFEVPVPEHLPREKIPGLILDNVTRCPKDRSLVLAQQMLVPIILALAMANMLDRAFSRYIVVGLTVCYGLAYYGFFYSIWYLIFLAVFMIMLALGGFLWGIVKGAQPAPPAEEKKPEEKLEKEEEPEQKIVKCDPNAGLIQPQIVHVNAAIVLPSQEEVRKFEKKIGTPLKTVPCPAGLRRRAQSDVVKREVGAGDEYSHLEDF